MFVNQLKNILVQYVVRTLSGKSVIANMAVNVREQPLRFEANGR